MVLEYVMNRRVARMLRVFLAALFTTLTTAAFCQYIQPNPALDYAFKGAQVVDLATSKVSSVVKLREVVGIPPPRETVLVKVFKRESLPQALVPAFANPNTRGVAIAGRYVAILEAPFYKEYEDILRHELVHAYISMASPKPLPFWFQEASGVHFSVDKTKKFYGKASDEQIGAVVGHVVELDPTYKQKLQSFHYLIDRVGKKKFYQWYKNVVETGVVDARPLIGLSTKPDAQPSSPRRSFPVWLAAIAGAVVIVVAIIGFVVSRREPEVW